MSPSLCGLHDAESVAIAPPDTWLLDVVALSENPAPRDYARVAPGLNIITRLSWGFGSTGTLPLYGKYPVFAQRVAAYVANSPGCSRWIVANEPNLSREWPAPDGHEQPILPWQYGECYRVCRRVIHEIAGHEHDEVLIAAPGPWNAELKYEGNPNGDWIQYFIDVIKPCGNEIDGFALHSYTHGYNVSLVTSSARMNAPFQHRHYEFRTYRDYMEAIPDELSHLPCYITEANGNGPWQAVGLMPAMLGEIDAWNQASKQKIHAVIFYRYPKYDDFYIEGRSDVINEYHAAVARGYTSPVKGKEQMTTHLPVVSPGTPVTEPSLPPRQFDERLTARGVTIETPPLKSGEQYWRIVKAQWWNEQEAQGRHHIYVEANDGRGKPMETWFEVWWPSGKSTGKTNGRSGFDAGNFPMSKSLNEFGVGIDTEYPTETLKGIGMGADGNSGIHTSTGVVFQLATVPAVAVPAPPPVVGDGPQPVPPPITGPTATPITPAGARIRSGPGVTFSVLGAVATGMPMRVTGIAPSGVWYRVDSPFGVGWVSATVVSAKNIGNVPVEQPSEPPVQPPPQGDTWERSRAFVRRWEGDFQDYDWDIGNWTGCDVGKGEKKGTKYGISACSYPNLDIRNITMEQADSIFFKDYWQKSGADKLPWPYCLIVFDTACLHGTGAAQKWVAEVGNNPYAFAAKRLRVYTKSDNWENAGAGWVNRVADLLLEASK